MRIIWADRAIERLTDIRDYIAQDAPLTAEAVVKRIVKSTERLSLFPLSGRVVPEYAKKEVREVVDDPYRILYYVRADHIEIINILHTHQLLQ